MIRTNGPGDEPGILKLVGLSLGKTDRKRFQSLRHHRSHQRRKAAGIQTTGKKKTQWHITHEMAPHSRLQSCPQLIGLLGERCSVVHAELRRMPIAAYRRALLRRPLQEVPGQQFQDAAIKCFGSSHVTICQKLWHDGLVERRAWDAGSHDALDLRRKEQLVIVGGVIQRLDPEPIASDQQPALAAIPDSKCEHTLQPVEARGSVGFVQMKNRLGIAPGPVTMARSFHFTTEHGVVVDFTVENDPQTVVFVGHRLMSAVEIDDGQATMGQTYRSVQPHPRSVRTTVLLHRRHAFQARWLCPLPMIKFQNSSYGAHCQATSRSENLVARRRYVSAQAGPTVDQSYCTRDSFARCAISRARAGCSSSTLAAFAIADGSAAGTSVPDSPS